MDCKELRKIILSSTEYSDSRITEHIRKCSPCRKFLKAADLIDNSSELYAETPAGLEESCLEKLNIEFDKNRETAAKNTVSEKGITVRMKYLAAAAVLIAAVSALLTLYLVSFTSEKMVVVYLSLYAPEAELVSVVGDWNDWKPDADRLQDSDRDGRWEIRLKVIPGKEYRYQFLLDGKTRLPDPGSGFTVDDGFGGENSILDI